MTRHCRRSSWRPPGAGRVVRSTRRRSPRPPRSRSRGRRVRVRSPIPSSACTPAASGSTSRWAQPSSIEIITSPITWRSCSTTIALPKRSVSTKLVWNSSRSVEADVIQSATTGRERIANTASASSAVGSAEDQPLGGDRPCHTRPAISSCREAWAIAPTAINPVPDDGLERQPPTLDPTAIGRLGRPMSSGISADQLRQSFIDFFAAKDHAVVPSASLIPHDPTVMFTVAGMVPFKPYFVGDEVAAVLPRRELAEVRSRRWQAQRPRRRRAHQAPPRVLRDARQLQLRRLLQARDHPVELGARHR